MLDPVSLAGSFATIVGLVGLFKQERRADKDQGKDAFLNWLTEHNHREIKELIIHSRDLSTGIETALRENHEIILAKLNDIDEILASLFSHIQGISGISIALHPNAELSDQAVSILRQLVDSTATEFIEHRRGDGFITLHLNPGGQIETTQPRFLHNDLDALVQLNLLTLRIGSKGSRIFGITRNAEKLMNLIDSESQR
jgi:hypothetical protein